MSDAEIPEMQDHWEQTAEAIEAAVRKAKEQAANAQEEASRLRLEAQGWWPQIAYKTTYAISYGVVFPSVLIARAIPQENALVHGLIDGAQAAKAKVAEMKGKSEAAAI